MFVNDLYYAIKIWKRARKPMIPTIGKGKSLYILANGPSLSQMYEENIDFFVDKNVLCVNMIAETDFYTKLKPLIYVIIDGVPLGTDHNMTEDEKNVARVTRESIVNKTDWDMYLILPYASKGSRLAKEAANNKHIHVVFVNTNVYKGKNVAIEYFLWNKFWCCPRMANVLVASIFYGILMRFSEVFLYGADHDWIKSIEVDDKNRVFVCNKHVYKEENAKTLFGVPNENRCMKLGEVLEGWTSVWSTYYKLNDFAKKNKVAIYNATKNSLIDAFSRGNSL